MVFVQRRAEQPAWDVFPRVDGDHARNGQGLGAVDALDAGVGMR